MANDKLPTALILEDAVIDARILSTALKKLGVASTVVSSTSEFLMMVSQEPHDLYFVDLNVEVPLSGFDVIKSIRKSQGEKTPIVVVSGQTDAAAVAHSVELGATDYLFKPIDLSLLGKKLKSFLVKTDEIVFRDGSLFEIPADQTAAWISFSVEVEAIHEFGLRFISDHLLLKGRTYLFGCALWKQIFNQDEVELVIQSSWVDRSGSSGAQGEGKDRYGGEAEFSFRSEEERSRLKSWLATFKPTS